MSAASGAPVSGAALEALSLAATERFLAAGGERADLARLKPYGESISTIVPRGQYCRWPHEVESTRRRLLDRGGVKLAAAFHRLVIPERVAASRPRLNDAPLFGVCTPYFEQAVAGICADLLDAPDDECDLPNDGFAKDLSIASLRLWPLGVVLAEPRSGVPRRLLLEGGAPTLLRAGALYVRHRGLAPMYETHAYVRQQKDFNEAGWRTFYRGLAELMKHDPEIRGVFGNTWFWDPQIETVSPRLAYLRRVPMEGGAICVRVKTSDKIVEMALATSPTRRDLYKAGRYEPRNYLMLWPRDRLLAWAERQRREPASIPGQPSATRSP